MRKSEAQIQQAWARAVNRGGTFCTKGLGTEAVPAARIGKWRDGTKAPRCWELSELLPAMARESQEATIDLLDAMFNLGALGIELVPVTQVRPSQGIVAEVLDVGVAAGQLAEVVQRATSDGVVSTEEGEEVERAGRAAVREVLQVVSCGQDAQRPQLSLIAGGRT